MVAYVLGWPVPKEYFTDLKMCEDSVSLHCLCSWRTYRKGFVPNYLSEESRNAFVTNPLNWKTDASYAPKSNHKGAVLYKFNTIYPATNDARISNGLLWVKKPIFPWSFMYLTRNYHPGDINLFYINIRQNVEQRLHAYYKKYPPL